MYLDCERELEHEEEMWEKKWSIDEIGQTICNRALSQKTQMSDLLRHFAVAL